MVLFMIRLVCIAAMLVVRPAVIIYAVKSVTSK